MSAPQESAQSHEQRLIQQVAYAGDLAAFDQLMTPYVARIRGYLRGFVRQPADADDLTQNVLMTVWSQLHRYQGSGRFVAWLFVIAHREFLQHARRHRRYQKALDGVGNEPGNTAVADNAAVAGIDVQTVLNSLEPESRAVILLARAVGLTHAEIARALNKPVGTIKSMLSRATRSLIDDYAN